LTFGVSLIPYWDAARIFEIAQMDFDGTPSQGGLPEYTERIGETTNFSLPRRFGSAVLLPIARQFRDPEHC
jgi:hypothetical protein